MRLLRQPEFLKYLNRDESCYATGREWDTLIPQHRINRGNGGRSIKTHGTNKVLLPSNIIVFDSIRNGQIEADADLAQEARRYGWKLDDWMEPTKVPIWHARRGWLMLDDEFNATPANPALVDAWQREVELLVGAKATNLLIRD